MFATIAMLVFYGQLVLAGPASADHATVDATPNAATNFKNTEHTITATTSEPNVEVNFEIESGPNEDYTGNLLVADFQCTTDDVAPFRCSISYVDAQGDGGDGGEGTDSIRVWLDEGPVINNIFDPGETNEVVNKTWVARGAEDTVVDISPESDTNPSDDPDHTVTVTIQTTTGQPVIGTQAALEVDSGPNAGQGDICTTDDDGTCDLTYNNMAPVAGTDEFTVCDDQDSSTTCDGPENDEAETTGQKVWEDREPATLTLSPSSDANPPQTEHIVTATVRDQFGDLFQGADVDFKIVAGPNDGVGTTADHSDVTDANGTAEFSYTDTESTPANNVDTICAWFDADTDNVYNPAADSEDGGFCQPGGVGGPEDDPLTDTAQKTWVQPVEPTEPATLTLTPPSETNPEGTDHTVTATVVDDNGDPCGPGNSCEAVEVDFKIVEGPNGDGAPAVDGTDTTDASGQATFTYTDAASSEGDSVDTICAWFDEDGDDLFSPAAGPEDGGACDEPGTDPLTDTAQKTWVQPVEPTEPATLTLTPPSDTNPEGTDHTVTATVVDDNGDPCGPGNSCEAVEVDFKLIDGPNADGAATVDGSDTTDAGGQATFTYPDAASTEGDDVDTICAWFDEDTDDVFDPTGVPEDGGACDAPETDPLTDTAEKTWEREQVEPEECPGYEGEPGNHVVGTTDDDVLPGTEGRDIICGLAGDDTITGLGGDDILDGGSGADVIHGGPGDDLLLGRAGSDELEGDEGADELLGGAGIDVLRGGAQPDLLVGGPGADELRGQGGPDEVRDNRGGDLLVGGPGSDELRGGPGNDALRGGGGNDLLVGGGGEDELRGHRGDDIIRGRARADALYGGPGDDILNGGAGVDLCRGGPGNDTLRKCET